MTNRGFLSFAYVAEPRPLRGALVRLFLVTFITATITAIILLLAANQALAVGPHGPFDSTTEKCEKCHALHTASTKTLLMKKTPTALCQSCHSGGIGADTAVMQGALMKATTPGGTDYTEIGALLGGGFDTMNSANTTSKHNIGEMGVPFGSNNMGAQVELTCVSCHTPHEGPNYRLLRRWVAGGATDHLVTWNGPYILPDGTADYDYIEEDKDSGAPGTQYFSYNYKAGLSAWCAGCHTRYMIRQDATAYAAGDAIGAEVRYRHAVDVPVIGRYNIFNPATLYDLPTDLPLQDLTNNGRTNDDTILCLTCHKAHGTDSAMGAVVNAQAAGRGSLPNDSMLLRMNDRQVCQIACHKVVN